MTLPHRARSSTSSRRRPLRTLRRRVQSAICLAWLGLATTLFAAEPHTNLSWADRHAGSDAPSPAVLLDELESASRARAERMEQLRRQLLRLREHGRHHEPPPAEPAGPIPATVPQSLPIPAPADHAVSTRQDQLRQPSAATPAAPPTAHAATAETLTGTAIDRIALGDSLFVTGETALALQAYSGVEPAGLSAADRYWIEYQLANCHRKLGNTAEAEKRYRQLAGLIDAGWCARQSRWWLDALAARSALQRDLDQIGQTLNTLKAQLDDARPIQ